MIWVTLEKMDWSEEQSAVKLILAFCFSHFPISGRALIPSHLLMSLVSSWLCGMLQWFYCTASICARHLYTATCASQSVCGHPCASRGSLNGLSPVPRWQKRWTQAKWSTALQSREQARRSPAPSPPPPRTAKPRRPSRPRVLPPCRREPKRRLRPRWKASWIGSTSGRLTIRKPQAGESREGWGSEMGSQPVQGRGTRLPLEKQGSVCLWSLFVLSFLGVTFFLGLTLESGRGVLLTHWEKG